MGFKTAGTYDTVVQLRDQLDIGMQYIVRLQYENTIQKYMAHKCNAARQNANAT